MLRRLAFLAALSLAPSPACDNGHGDDEGDTTTDPAPLSPRDGCLAYVHAYCLRDHSCDGVSATECAEQLQAAMPGQAGCEGATALRSSDELVSCLAQLEAMTCTTFDAPSSTLPPECADQFTFDARAPAGD